MKKICEIENNKIKSRKLIIINIVLYPLERADI